MQALNAIAGFASERRTVSSAQFMARLAPPLQTQPSHAGSVRARQSSQPRSASCWRAPGPPDRSQSRRAGAPVSAIAVVVAAAVRDGAHGPAALRRALSAISRRPAGGGEMAGPRPRRQLWGQVGHSGGSGVAASELLAGHAPGRSEAFTEPSRARSHVQTPLPSAEPIPTPSATCSCSQVPVQNLCHLIPDYSRGGNHGSSRHGGDALRRVVVQGRAWGQQGCRRRPYSRHRRPNRPAAELAGIRSHAAAAHSSPRRPVQHSPLDGSARPQPTAHPAAAVAAATAAAVAAASAAATSAAHQQHCSSSSNISSSRPAAVATSAAAVSAAAALAPAATRAATPPTDFPAAAAGAAPDCRIAAPHRG